MVVKPRLGERANLWFGGAAGTLVESDCAASVWHFVIQAASANFHDWRVLMFREPYGHYCTPVLDFFAGLLRRRIPKCSRSPAALPQAACHGRTISNNNIPPFSPRVLRAPRASVRCSSLHSHNSCNSCNSLTLPLPSSSGNNRALRVNDFSCCCGQASTINNLEGII